MQGVYAWTNTVNGKVYVGSSTDVCRRKSAHLRRLKAGKHENEHLQRAWNKYGPTAFEFEILEVVDDLIWLRARETAWIYHLQSANSEYGYNSAIDGWNPVTATPAIRKKLSQSLKKRWANGQVKRPTYEQMAGQRATLKAKWADPVWRTAILEKRKNQWTPEARFKKSTQAKNQWTSEQRTAQAARLRKQQLNNPEMSHRGGLKGSSARWKKEN
jgi:group I intron endonuclease